MLSIEYPVYSISNGVVRSAAHGGTDWGYYIIIDHNLLDNSIISSMYAHLKIDSFDTFDIYPGKNVSRGEQIGSIGATSVSNGVSWAPHLHFEIRSDSSLGVEHGYAYDSTGWLEPTNRNGDTDGFIDSHRPQTTPLIGDWDNNNIDNTGTFDPRTSMFSLGDDAPLQFGESGDIPIIGDWNGDGTDTIGVYRPKNATFYLDFDNDQTADQEITFGEIGDFPIVGDWNNNGIDTIGIYRLRTAEFHLDFNNDRTTDQTIQFEDIGDFPIVGDWDNDGADDIGVFRRNDPDYEYNAVFYLRNIAEPISFGNNDDTPIVGKPDIDGLTRVGVYRPSEGEPFIFRPEPITDNGNPSNIPPDLPITLGQWDPVGATLIPFGGITNENTILFDSTVSDPDNDDVLLEVEVQPLGTAFTDTLTCTSDAAVASGMTASATCSGLADGQYHWQARARDSNDETGAWLSAGENPETSPDFEVLTGGSTDETGRTGGPDHFGYTFKDSNSIGGPNYDWIDITSTGTRIIASCDDCYVNNIPVGFFFNYYGTDYSQLSITNNGLTLASGGTSQWTNQPIGSSTPHNFIAPFWDDIVTWDSIGADAIYYQTIGEAPNRRFVVEWHDNYHYYSSPSGVTFEVILYEGTNNIKFQYKDVDFDVSSWDNGASATVGIESADGRGLQYSYNEQVLNPSLAILFKFPAFSGTNMYLSKNAPASMDHGNTMTYTLYYNNFGDTIASNVILEDTLPSNVEFVSASDGGTYNSATRKVTWNIGSVPVFPSGRGSRNVTVRIPSGVPVGTVIQNTASITTTTLETRYDDNSASASTTVTGSTLPPDVSVGPTLGNSAGTPAVYWGNPTTYSYQSSSSTVTGVDITIHIDDGGSDITGSMVGTPSGSSTAWAYTAPSFYPRHGTARVTYTINGGAANQPMILSRTEWGCPEGELSPSFPPQYHTPTHIIIHHTDTPNTDTDWAGRVNQIWDYHTNNNGWGDIGYNYLIDPNGVIYEGRAGGDNVIGAHALGHNIGTVGIAFIGTFSDVEPTPAALSSAETLIAWISDQNNIDPLGSGTDIGGANINNIAGHRDVSSSQCPGDTLYGLLTNLRQNVNNILSGTGTITYDIYIDPAGYIYDIDTSARISGASVWLQIPDGEGGWENVLTGQTPAISQPDENPLITNAAGQYQWDVLEGAYRVHVEATGYYPRDSDVVNIPPPVYDLHVGLTHLPDSTPPVITNIGATSDSNSAVITWDTDEASDSLVKYGTSSGSYTLSESSSNMVLSHSVSLTGLTSDTLYYYVVNSTDGSHNSAQSTERTFRTQALADTTPPVIESITLYPVNATAGATINISVRASDDRGVVDVTANGNSLMASNGFWNGSITAPSTIGSYAVTIRASDAATNFAEGTADYKVVAPTGSLGVGVAPKITTVSTTGATIDYTIKIKSIQNFDDIVSVNITMDGFPVSYQMPLGWFEWNDQTINIAANSTVSLPLRLTLPPGQTAGRKAFKVRANSTRWITTAFDSGVITIS